MKLTWRTLSLGLGLLALAGTGCDDVNFCTNRDDAGLCPDIDFPQFDGSVGMDGATPPSSDAARADATTVLPDGAVVVADAGIDASLDAAAAPDAAVPLSYNVEEYCAAQYRIATAWRDKFEACCATATTAADERTFFLLGALLYDDGSDPMSPEAVGACVNAVNASIGPNMTYVPSAAVACADKFASQFSAPPDGCPKDGFAIEMLEATFSHGAQVTTQLPECRAAFVGKVAFNGSCASSFECQTGLRCLGSMNSKTCRAPLGLGNTCSRSSECQDGFICQGSNTAGRSCQPTTAPVEVSSNCSLSTECRTGLICPEGTCVNPSPTLFCKQ